MSWLQCPTCGLFLPCEATYDPDSQTATVVLERPHDDCNPAMVRFFNEESQHFPPFGR